MLLRAVLEEANNRGYKFDQDKIANKRSNIKIKVTSGLVNYEFEHLMKKLKVRDPEQYAKLKTIARILLHPDFKKIKGDIESWEIV